MKLENHSSEYKCVRLVLENDEMLDFYYDMERAIESGKGATQTPVAYTFMISNWCQGKSIELNLISIDYLNEIVDYLESNFPEDNLTSTSKVIVEFAKHAKKRRTKLEGHDKMMKEFF